jgi:prepilin-type N-terminal cleavage/methylation domain-containing protein
MFLKELSADVTHFRRFLVVMGYRTMLKTSAFSLLEVIIAMVVLSIGIFAASAMQMKADDTCSSAFRRSTAMRLADNKLEELMSMEYADSFADPDLMADINMPGGFEPFVDKNANGLWDPQEAFTDLNKNHLYDPAHIDPNSLGIFRVSWSIVDHVPANEEKLIRVYVQGKIGERITTLTCIKAKK